MLGGEPGESLSAETGELIVNAGRLGEAFFERGDLVLEPGDLRISRIGSFAGLLECVKALLEFGAQVCVGAVTTVIGPAPGPMASSGSLVST